MKTLETIRITLLIMAVVILKNPASAQDISYDFDGDDITAGEDHDWKAAENEVENYLDLSFQHIKQGHDHALADFAVWYRQHEAERMAAMDDVMSMLTKSLLLTAFNQFVKIPAVHGTDNIGLNGESFFGAVLKGFGKSSVNRVNDLIHRGRGPTNVDAVVDLLTKEQHIFIDSLTHFPVRYMTSPETWFQEVTYETAKYKDSFNGPGLLPPTALEYLEADGVLAPTAETLNQVREDTLTELIATIYKNTFTITGMSVGEFGNFDEDDEARAVAQRIIYGEE